MALHQLMAWEAPLKNACLWQLPLRVPYLSHRLCWQSSARLCMLARRTKRVFPSMLVTTRPACSIVTKG